MKTIKLVKLEEREDATHPHNIEVGTVVVVDVYDHSFFTPQVGSRFNLIGPFRWYSTSMVEEIIDDNTFKTLNSIYRWEEINNK